MQEPLTAGAPHRGAAVRGSVEDQDLPGQPGRVARLKEFARDAWLDVAAKVSSPPG